MEQAGGVWIDDWMQRACTLVSCSFSPFRLTTPSHLPLKFSFCFSPWETDNAYIVDEDSKLEEIE